MGYLYRPIKHKGVFVADALCRETTYTALIKHKAQPVGEKYYMKGGFNFFTNVKKEEINYEKLPTDWIFYLIRNTESALTVSGTFSTSW